MNRPRSKTRRPKDREALRRQYLRLSEKLLAAEYRLRQRRFRLTRAFKAAFDLHREAA
jgi:hypothetical protein